MDVSKALLGRRTSRKLKQDKIDQADLEKLVDFARLSALPATIQPLRFAIINEERLVKATFPHTKWAGYMPENGTPKAGEEPTAYIAILGHKATKSAFEVEAGAAITSMMLGAFEMGIGSCWLGSINRKELLELYGISGDEYELVYLLALGYPNQESRAVTATDSIKYYEDENGGICVPKLSLDEVIVDL